VTICVNPPIQADYPDAAPPADYRAELAVAKARIVAAADEARRSIDRDLHDGLQQRLVSLALEARQAEASVPGGQQELKSELARIADGLAEALDNIREIARGIHPAVLSEYGLGAAVKTLARRSPVPVRLHLAVEGRLAGPVEAGAYYIICEALTNVAKHARASVVDVAIAQCAHFLDLSVDDDGVGGATQTGPGLTGLSDRVDALCASSCRSDRAQPRWRGSVQMAQPAASSNVLTAVDELGHRGMRASAHWKPFTERGQPHVSGALGAGPWHTDKSLRRYSEHRHARHKERI
jgi:Histidine kinase